DRLSCAFGSGMDRSRANARRRPRPATPNGRGRATPRRIAFQRRGRRRSLAPLARSLNRGSSRRMNLVGATSRMPEYAKLVVDGIRWQVPPGSREILAADSLRLDEHIRLGAAEVVKHGPHRTVYQVRIGNLSVFWKHCRISGLRAWLRQCVRPP